MEFRLRPVSSALFVVAAGALTLALGACRNTLDFGTAGTRDCGVFGTICTIGPSTLGDGAAATKASFTNPFSVTPDGSGGWLIADTGDNRIRRIDAQGNVTTLAGTGRTGESFVPGQPATATDIAAPWSVARASNGWIYWNDLSTCNVYGLSPTDGTVSVVAGNGSCNGSGDGPEPGTPIAFGGCGKISVDSLGNIIVADTDTYRVRYVNVSGNDVTVWGVTAPAGEITTVAGVSSYSASDYLGPDGVPATSANGTTFYPCHAMEAPDGKLWIADSGHSAIRMVDTTGFIYTIVGGHGGGYSGDGGLARNAVIDDVEGLFADGQGRVFFTDARGHLRFADVGGQANSFGGVSVNTNGIESLAGYAPVFALTSDGGPAGSQVFAFFNGTAPVEDANGDLFVPDPGNGVVRKIDHTGGTMSVAWGYAPGGSLSQFLHAPAGIAVDAAGEIFVNARNFYLDQVDGGGNVSAIAGTGSPVATGDGGPATAAGYWGSGLAFGPDGALYIADPYNHVIRRIDQSGVINTIAGNGNDYVGGDAGPAISASFDGPYGIAVDTSGNIFATDYDRVRFINRGIANTTRAGVTVAPNAIDTIAGGNGSGSSGDGGPALAAQLYLESGTDVPTGMALYQGGLYIADYRNNRIRRVDLDSGILTTVAGSGADSAAGIGRPIGLAVANGYLYWTQQTGSMVKRMKLPAGPVENVAGDGHDGYFGDHGDALAAELFKPQGLAAGPGGELYVADGSHHVRRIQP